MIGIYEETIKSCEIKAYHIENNETKIYLQNEIINLYAVSISAFVYLCCTVQLSAQGMLEMFGVNVEYGDNLLCHYQNGDITGYHLIILLK